MPTVVANFQRDLGSIRVFLGSTLYQNRFWAQTRRKPAPLQPPNKSRQPQYLAGGGKVRSAPVTTPSYHAPRLYCAHTRGITHYACKVFFLDFWHFFVAFLYDFFCIHSTFADGVWLAFAAMRLIVRCPRRIVAPFFVAGGGGVRQPRRGQAAPCAQGCTDTTQVPILQRLA